MIGLCIKHQHENYGGILQAYATVSFFEEQNIDYELIRYTRKKTLPEAIRDIPRLLNLVWLNSRYEGLQRKLNLRLHPQYARNNAVRMKAFSEFKAWAFHKFSEEYLGYAALREGGRKYSALVTGSDQLWSPAGLPTNYYNLMFAPDETLKVSLASSFGVKNIPWYQKKRTRQFLERLQYISMRENRGSEIVEELIHKSVPTVLDPVFYLSRQDWLERIPNEALMEEPYVLAYFLGSNQEYREAVSKYTAQKNIKLVVLRHMDQYVPEDENFGDYAPYDVDPRTFLNLIRNAQTVFTDSYHGTAFSIINEKQFVVFDRYRNDSGFSKNSRIDTLCSNLGLESRRYRAGEELEEMVAQTIDYVRVNEKLDAQKRITSEYLEEILQEIRKQERQVCTDS